MNLDLSSLSVGAQVILGGLVLVQVLLLAVALVDLLRRPAELVAGGAKWVWLVVIVLANLIGPILYFAIGRTTPAAIPGEPQDAVAERAGADTAAVADALYGPRSAP